MLFIKWIELVKVFLGALMDGQNYFFFLATIPGVQSGDPLDIPWVISRLSAIVVSTYSKSKVSLRGKDSIFWIIKTFFYTLGNKRIFLL